MSKNNTAVQEGIFDVRKLGIPKMILLGMQHTFAMFGATVLVPIMTGLNVSTTLLMAGLGTLLFHFITKGKVPRFFLRIPGRLCGCCTNAAGCQRRSNYRQR
mgnify:CR=1 FL=1